MTAAELDSRALLREAHAKPIFDLADEPWIPVRMVDSTTATMGLRDIFVNANNIAALAIADPVGKAAMMRLLIAFTAQLVRLSRDSKKDWNQRLAENSGFMSAHVEALMSDQAEYLWLYHPRNPFLQDLRLLDAMDPIAIQRVTELVPTVPGRSESAWFTKPTDQAATEGRSPATVARLLTARWFYALPGNSSAITAAGERLTIQAGGAFSEGPAIITHAFRIGPSLFHSLLRNLTPTLADPIQGEVSGLAWIDVDRPQLSGDALYLATTTGTSTLLASIDFNGMIGSLIRAGIPRPKAITGEVRDLARDADTHRLISVQTTKSGPVRKTVRVAPGQHRLRALDQIRAGALANDRGLRGIVNPADIWLGGNAHTRIEEIEFVSGAKQGMAASPKWRDTAAWSSQAPYLDPNSREFQQLSQCLEACFAKKSGVLSLLDWAIRLAVGEVAADGSRHPADRTSVPAAALLETATAMFLDGAGGIIERARVGNASSDLDESELISGLFRLAQDTYRSVLRPYENSPRYCETIIRSRRVLIERRPDGANH